MIMTLIKVFVSFIDALLDLIFGKETKNSDDATLPYALRDHLMSNAETSFYRVLESSIPELVIFTKVRISDLVYVKKRNKNIGHANRIDRKHVDFVICDDQTLLPILVIELDDSSHQRQDRIRRDKLVDSVFETVELPLMRVKASRSYSPRELREQIHGMIS